jgi:hypothetical protein
MLQDHIGTVANFIRHELVFSTLNIDSKTFFKGKTQGPDIRIA